MHLTKTTSKLLIIGFAANLISCAATQTALEHRSLATETRLSKTIFLDPVADKQKTVYVSIKNTSDQEIDISKQVTGKLITKGYQVVTNPNLAHYLLQANILKVGKMNQATSRAILSSGYGSAIESIGAGAAFGVLTNDANATIAGGLAGGLLDMTSQALIKAVNYTMITDVQISERVGAGVKVSENFSANLENGTRSNTSQTYAKTSNYQRFRTRIVSNADKVNLNFADARPALEHGLTKAIAGIF